MRRFLQTGTVILALALAYQAAAQNNDQPRRVEHLPEESEATGQATRGTTGALDRAFNAMYDLDFTQADAEVAQFTEERPNDPLGPAAQAASVLFSIFEQNKILQGEFFISDDRFIKRKIVVPDAAALQLFESALKKAERLATLALAKNSHDENALFGLTLVYGLRADYAALVERRDAAALHFSEKGNQRARQLLATSPDFYDAYVATGIQKYLVGLRPAPVRWMLALGGIKGDRDQGVRELEIAAARGHYLAPFARILLAIAHLRKHERKEAVELLTDLRQQFPHNPLFAEEIARIADVDTALPRHSAASNQPQGNGQ